MPEAYVEKTQALLGAIITAPKLTEKLLMKPPFRFLHDIVTSFLGVTAFPQGLYSEEMLDSSKTTEKPKKIEFLRLLIAAVEAATGAKVAAQPSKIVAGQEADKTNELLQLLSACAGLTPQQKAAAVQKAKSADGGARAEPMNQAEKVEKDEKAKEREKDPKDEERQRRKEEERRRRKEEDAAAERKLREREEMVAHADKKSAGEGGDRKQRAEDLHEGRKESEEDRKRRSDRMEERAQKNDDEERRRRHEEKRRHERKDTAEKEEAALKDESSVTPPFSRGVLSEKGPGTSASFTNAITATAGKAPPRKKPAHQVVDGSESAVAPVAGVIHEIKRTNGENAGEAVEEDENNWMKIAEQQEMKSAVGDRGSDADGAGKAGQDTEARGYLGQQALKAKREQEKDAARRAEEAEARALQGGGGIVIHTSKSGKSGAAMGEGELSKLRERLQLLTKATNPLGKLLESIYDDIDAMARELEMWRSEARTQALAAADARRQTMDSLQEVHAQLQNVEDAINDQILKTHNIRRNVINNDNAIAGMVRMIVNPDVANR